ncbi:MAG: hypothetical protein H7Y42_01965 [Chitinophagaceae bacterium]|nr:hypothetical protein [Chitinophagaceae bacterium]
MKKIFSMMLMTASMYCSGQAGTDIYLFDLSMRNGKVIISGGKNFTNRIGYDNQPFFHPSKPIIYFSAFNDSGRSDIKYFDYRQNTMANLTTTPEREYSPTVTPDGKFISCIIQRDNGAQDLAKYPIGGGDPVVLINNLVVGYHSWIDRDKLLLFVLGDSNRHTLHYYQLASKKDSIIAAKIGRSLHKIPGKREMSFVQTISDKESIVQRFNPTTMTVCNVISALPGQDHLAWLNGNTLLMSDGNQLFYYTIGKTNSWQPVEFEGQTKPINGISRLAVNGERTKIAVVVNEAVANRQ